MSEEYEITRCGVVLVCSNDYFTRLCLDLFLGCCFCIIDFWDLKEFLTDSYNIMEKTANIQTIIYLAISMI